MQTIHSSTPVEPRRAIRVTLLVAVCLALLVTGCSSGGSSEPEPSDKSSSSTPTPSEESAPPAAGGDLTGTWAGTLSSYRGNQAAFTVDLQQDGAKFVGQLHVPTALCNKEATVTGTQEAGGKLEFGVSQGADLTATFTGTVDGTTMSGTWSSPAGGDCGSDHGEWSGKKVS